MRTAARRDANEQEIIDALRQAGASVQQLSQPDVPDLLVGYQGVNHLLEVKETTKGMLRSGQISWALKWKGRSVWIVDAPETALLAIGPWKPKRKGKP